MSQLAIRGHKTRGNEVIEILKMLGGKNRIKLNGDTDSYLYFINDVENNIVALNEREANLSEFDVFTLEEFLKRYPYKVGNKVLINDVEDNVHKIIGMNWSGNKITYSLKNKNNEHTKKWESNELEPYEPTIEEQINNESSKTISQHIATLDTRPLLGLVPVEGDKHEIMPSKGYEIKQDREKYYLVKTQPQYPKTYEECCKILFPYSMELGRVLTSGCNCELLKKLGVLLICRDAYWKIAGDWKPNWCDENKLKYCIECSFGTIDKTRSFVNSCILAFPTEEMRDAFYENFKSLIEECKELL